MNEDVNPLHNDGTPKSSEEIEQEKAVLADQAPGSKTSPAKLLEALQEEREKRRDLEDRIAMLEEEKNPTEVSSEVKELQRQIKESNDRIDLLSEENAKKDILIQYPVMSEKWSEFETFRADPENKGMNLKTAVKSFLVENGLLDKPRLGLEKPTGGPRVQLSTNMTVEDIKLLRETDFKKYTQLLEKGLIKI